MVTSDYWENSLLFNITELTSFCERRLNLKGVPLRYVTYKGVDSESLLYCWTSTYPITRKNELFILKVLLSGRLLQIIEILTGFHYTGINKDKLYQFMPYR